MGKSAFNLTLLLVCLAGSVFVYNIGPVYPIAQETEPTYIVFHAHTYITIRPGVTIHDPDCEMNDLRELLNARNPVVKKGK